MALGVSLAAGPPPWLHAPVALALIAGGLVLAVVGLCDDRWGAHPLIRLVAQIGVAVAFVAAGGVLDRLPLPAPLDLPLGPLGPLVVVVWIVAVVNFYNFMDGIDGLAGLQAVVTGTALAMAGVDPLLSFLGAALAGAAASFLLFNWPPASIFLGDIGSGVLGWAFATLPFLAIREARGRIMAFVALSLWFFLADASWTLLRRLARGERLHEAHREHLYQRLVDSGWSHARVTTVLGLGSVGVTGLALAALRLGHNGIWWTSFLVAIVLFGVEVRLVRSRERRGAGVTDKGGALS